MTNRKTRDADLALLLDDWSRLTAFFGACEERFHVEHADLFMRHRSTGAKVDVVPCGALEDPPGTLRIPGSVRDLNTQGLREAFDTARTLRLGSLPLLVPTPSAFVLLKCLSFLDRRAPHDLRDAGSVLQRFPVPEDVVWTDELAMEGFADGTLAWEDMNAWMLGRSIVGSFSETTRAVFARAIEQLASEPPATRRLFADERGLTDEQLQRADRQLEVLRRASRVS